MNKAASPVHDAIKRRREAKGWSHTRLAEEVSKREGRARPLAWQTVQHWEGGSGPTRSRLPYVAAALGCEVDDLLQGTDIADAATPEAAEPFSPDLVAHLKELSNTDLRRIENSVRAQLDLPPLGQQDVPRSPARVVRQPPSAAAARRFAPEVEEIAAWLNAIPRADHARRERALRRAAFAALDPRPAPPVHPDIGGDDGDGEDDQDQTTPETPATSLEQSPAPVSKSNPSS